jgi:hypothetical protein
VNEIPEIHLQEKVVGEVRENEIETGIQEEVEHEAEVGEMVNGADDERGEDEETSDFCV